ncbi:DUF4349 domain-containing protein [Niabella hirudinis]|uniref:DUF4349 domain-containing protein n=1 Tax=Niabella hirudinis TaxID=1285929 RepID=UPI003EBB9219
MKRLFFAIAILPGLLIACSRSTERSAPTGAEMLTKNEAAKTEMIPVGRAPDSLEAPATLVPAQTDFDRKIIKDATVKMEVTHFGNYAGKVRTLTKKYGAYISKEENADTDEKNEVTMSIKVPVFYFEDLLNELPDADAKQLERTITSDEAGGQIVDTKARLLTQKQTRDKYIEFLKQGKNVEDVLKVQAEINNLQENIESAERRLAYLSAQTRFSTINLSFFQPKEGYNYDTKPGIGSRVLAAFKSGGNGLMDLLVSLLYLWPLWAAGIVAGVLIKKFRWNRTINNR